MHADDFNTFIGRGLHLMRADLRGLNPRSISIVLIRLLSGRVRVIRVLLPLISLLSAVIRSYLRSMALDLGL